MVRVYMESVGRRSSCSKWLGKFHEVALAMSCIVAAWICIFLTSQILPNFCKKCSFVCSFQHDIEYNKVSYFLQIFQVQRRASIWSSNFLVVSRCEIWSVAGCIEEWGEKEPEKLCKLFDTERCFWFSQYWKKEWTVPNFWDDLYPTTPSFYTVGFTSIAIDLLEEKLKNEHQL